MGVVRGANNPSPLKLALLRNMNSCLRSGLRLWYDLSNEMFDNMVLRRIFVPKRDQVTGEWKKLHNEELSDLYSTPNIGRVIK